MSSTSFTVTMDMQMLYTGVVYITYTMATRDSPDIYMPAPSACGPRVRAYIYQANPSVVAMV